EAVADEWVDLGRSRLALAAAGPSIAIRLLPRAIPVGEATSRILPLGRGGRGRAAEAAPLFLSGCGFFRLLRGVPVRQRKLFHHRAAEHAEVGHAELAAAQEVGEPAAEVRFGVRVVVAPPLPAALA